jgi:DeoR/GlpR family transcriptional regulator of sugar metabolism
MATRVRLQQILDLIEANGYLSVKELSGLCHVSEVTIRRDLQRLVDEKALQRTYGGVVAVPAGATRPVFPITAPITPPDDLSEGFLTDRVDVLIATPVDPRFDRILVERAGRHQVPIVAESLALGSADRTQVTVDNYQAAAELGRWTAAYVRDNFAGRAVVLDLTFRQKNTRERSRGFMDGLGQALPGAQMALSIDAGSTIRTACQLTADALVVHPDINVIFAINDATAYGAMQALKERGVDPRDVLLLTFGLEGETLRRAVLEGGYCKAGLAMFPEIVGPVCVRAAIAAYNMLPLPLQLTTPHAVVTTDTLRDFYSGPEAACQIRWDVVRRQLHIPLDIDPRLARPVGPLPSRIGFVVPFMEHDWYRSLITCMKEHAGNLGVDLESADAAQLLRDDLALRQQAIAESAAEQVHPGDVVLIDGDPLNIYLAHALVRRNNITVITNSLQVCEILRGSPHLTLVSTGGLIRPGTDSLSGPTAESTLRDLRADKLFLTVTGVSLDYGLSHANLGEVAIKQAMVRAAREVIVLADYFRFEQDAVGQVAPITAAHKLITDNALPAGTRLELSKLGITVIIARD